MVLIDSDLPPWLVRFQRGLQAVSSKKHEGSVAKTHRYDPSYFRPQDTVPTDLMLVAIAHEMRSKCAGGAQPWQ